MRHHQYNPTFQFVKEPIEFNKHTERNILQYCLGATLYMPGTREIVNKILNKEMLDVTSIVMDFEDAISESDLAKAEENVLFHLDKIAEAINQNQISLDNIPLIFLRVRNKYQFKNFAEQLTRNRISVLAGFVFPKFDRDNAFEFFQQLENVCKEHNETLFGMPILEGRTIAYKETRFDELMTLKKILEPFKERILNIRVGGTDFSALFGVRRGINYSIYDIMTVRDSISDILNFFNRAEDEFSVSAPVWEYFLAHKKDDIYKLLNNDIHKSLLNKTPIINDAIDGLLREVILDKANGFIGKTIIHPSHARFVNAMQTTTKEEYDDALQIIENSGGVIKSAMSNKMNEMNPHRNWAKRILLRASAFGVVENDISMLKLILG